MSRGASRRPGPRFVAPIASLAIVAAGCGSSEGPASDTSPSTRTTAVTTTPVTRTATTPTTTTRSVVTKGSGGRLYRCIGASLLDDLRTLSRRIERGRASIKRIQRELRRLSRRYPDNVAPPRVAARYNYLVRKYKGLLRLGNRRVRAYNRRLARDCTRG